MRKFDVVQTWIDNVAYSHSKSKNTEYKYKHYLKAFCEYVGKTPEQILEEYENTTDRRFRRKYAQCLKALISQQIKEGYAPTSIRSMVGSIKSFFKYSDLPLGHVPMGRKTILYHNRDITKEEIGIILETSDPRDRAFFCMMGQTGLRPDTLCSLRLKHIEPEFSKGIIPCKVDVPQDIAKGEYRSYFTFMGEESVKHLKAYLATRSGVGSEDYLFTSHGVDKRANPKSMSRIFARTIQKLKQKGLMEFEEGPEGKPSEVRLYNLRKFFRKYANQAGFEFVQFWMGHIVKEGQDEHYRPQDVEFHRQLYAEKAMPFLRLETATPSETEQTIMDLRSKLEQRNHVIAGLSKEIEQLWRNFEGFGPIFKVLARPEVIDTIIDSFKDPEIQEKMIRELKNPQRHEAIKEALNRIRKHTPKAKKVFSNPEIREKVVNMYKEYGEEIKQVLKERPITEVVAGEPIYPDQLEVIRKKRKSEEKT